MSIICSVLICYLFAYAFSSGVKYKLNTDKTQPLTSIINASLKSRKDEVKDGKIRDQILKNSPEKNEEFFVVPKVIE